MDEAVPDRSFGDAWDELAPPARRSFELAHITLLAGGLAVGSVITDTDGRIVAEGRNRAYDPTTATDPLEGTPLAHAEMNALARLATDCEPADFTIWSTQQPCSMCAAAISFVGIRHVIAVARDPSDPARPTDEALDDVWVVLATVMFLMGPLRVGGADHPMVRANAQLEPEAVALALRSTATADDPLTDGRALEDALRAMWDDLQAAATARRERTATS